MSSTLNINQKRQFMKHRSTEQPRNQIVTVTTEVTKLVNDFFCFLLNFTLVLLSCSVAQCFTCFLRFKDQCRRCFEIEIDQPVMAISKYTRACHSFDMKKTPHGAALSGWFVYVKQLFRPSQPLLKLLRLNLPSACSSGARGSEMEQTACQPGGRLISLP